MQYIENLSFSRENVNVSADNRKSSNFVSEIQVMANNNKIGYEPILMSIDIEPTKNDDLGASINQIRKTAAATNELGDSNQQNNRLTLGAGEDIPIGDTVFRNSQPLLYQDSV